MEVCVRCAPKLLKSLTRAREMRSGWKFEERCACVRAKNGRTLIPWYFGYSKVKKTLHYSRYIIMASSRYGPTNQKQANKLPNFIWIDVFAVLNFPIFAFFWLPTSLFITFDFLQPLLTRFYLRIFTEGKFQKTNTV